MVNLCNYVKNSMGITSSDFDKEIESTIKACFLELDLAGIYVPKDNNIPRDFNELLKQALVFYCKAYFRMDASSPNYLKAFEHLKDAMSLSGEYRDV